MPTIICDLDRVLLDEDPERRLAAWRSGQDVGLPIRTAADLEDAAATAFRTGALSEGDFLDHLRARLAWTGSDDALVAGWTAARAAVSLEVLDVLSGLKDRGWRLVGATDTDPWTERAVTRGHGWALSGFERIVRSLDVRVTRPDPRFFAEILRGLPMDGPRLYVDADPLAVSAARRAGLDAHLFTGADALRAAGRAAALTAP